ncbi:unnamed protein product [Medioppia subpectinata]|uniref:RNB domain-containing protein n=1 Tax=Medioppia subpectinata TaxID=1979941 RepID=A0A7R9KVF3_9ACAR|nr:unnamed protein product [Medioppia subpectinata]CAG2110448.1 unnamed protein product [Medioppia subpectinata]
MSAIKTFHRKTKKGSVVKVVREHYLREDIHCGRESCADCQPFKQSSDSPFAPKAYLSDSPRVGVSAVTPLAHYVVPDFGVVYSQLDVIIDPYFGCDIILMQTVWDEIKRNITVFSQIKQVMAEKRFYVFLNEYNKNTFSERVFGESIAEYKQRLVVSAAEWLQSHLKDIQLVLIVNSNEMKLKSESIQCFPIDKYVKSLKDCVNLVDKLADMSTTGEYAKDIKLIFDEHLGLDAIQSGIKSGTKYFQGKYYTNRLNYLEGFVMISRNGEELNVLIQGSLHINRAISDDIVAIELLPESEWTSKSDVVLEVNEDLEDNGDNREDREESVIFKKEDTSTKTPMGRVVGIIRRNWRQYCGVLRKRNENMNTSSMSNRHLFVPLDRKIPFIRIETRQYEHLKEQRIVVAIDSWPRDSKYPKGHYVRCVGAAGTKETETEVILLENDIPHMEFSNDVMKCLPKEGREWRLSEEDLVNRTDLRGEAICSVDPPGCTDIDDALHCKDIGNGLFEIGVHIADVSHFIKPKTALDREAADRGTSVYLVRQRIDMIPTLLSSDLCSLREDVDRLTFSVIWTLDANTAEIKTTKFMKSVIRSRASLTYGEAQNRIDSPHMNDDVTRGLRGLLQISKILNRKRIEGGALVLASANEIKFVEMDSETHENPNPEDQIPEKSEKVLKIEAKQIYETNSMIEEFMLLANISVAKRIYEEFPSLSLLRRHPTPSSSNFEDLMGCAKSKGYNMDTSSGKSLSDSLNKAIDPDNPFMNLMFRMVTTRCMTQALYFCSGSLADETENFGHYGLATPIYTHFTSPIRRYADLMVHRLLSHVIEYEAIDASLLNQKKMHELCEQINFRNKMARQASRSSNELHSHLLIKDHTSSGKPLEEEGYIIYVKKNALQIFIPRLALELSYFLDPKEDWIYNEFELTQQYLPLKYTLKLFDKLKVRLSVNENALSLRSKLVIELIEPFCVQKQPKEKSNKKLKKV